MVIKFVIHLENFEAIRQLNPTFSDNNSVNVNKNVVINCFRKVRKYSNNAKKKT